MAGPWEDYQQQAVAPEAPTTPKQVAGPWDDYKQPEATPTISQPPTAPWEEFKQAQPEATPEKKHPSNWVWSDITTDDELDKIAKKHGVSLDALRESAAYFGATKSDESIKDLIKQGAGFVGESAVYGAPQKIYKMAQHPEMERALDDLDKLAYEKKSKLRVFSELVGGLATGAAETKLLGKAAVPVIGATIGASHAEQGHELQGAGLGVAAGAVLHGASKLLGNTAIPLIGSAIGYTSADEGEKGTGMLAGAAAGAGLIGAGKGYGKIEQKIAKWAAEKGETVGLTKTTEGIEHIIEREMQNPTHQGVLEARQEALKTGDVSNPEMFLKNTKDLEIIKSPKDNILAMLDEHLNTDFERSLAKEVAQEALIAERNKIAKSVGADSWEQAIKENGGIDRLVDDVYPNIYKEKIATDYIREQSLGQNLRPLTKIEQLNLGLADNTGVSKVIDKRLGIGYAPVLEKVSTNIIKHSPAVNQNIHESEVFLDKLNKKGITPEDFRVQYLAKKADPELVREWDILTDGFLTRVNDAGAGIGKKKNYMRDQVQSPVELRVSLTKRAEELGPEYLSDLSQEMLNTEMQKGGNHSFQEFVHAVELVSSKPITTPQELQMAYRDIVEGVIAPSDKLVSTLSAAKHKAGLIPDFIIEKNPITAINSWTQSAYRELAIRGPMNQMKSMANIAEAAGDNFAAKHIRDTMQDIMGVRKDTFAGASKQLADKWAVHWKNKGHDTIALAPDLYKVMNNQIYPTMTGGLSIRARLQDILNPILGVIPEVGTEAGAKAWWSAAGDVVNLFKSKGLKGAEEFLAEKGMLPANQPFLMGAPEIAQSKLAKLNRASNEALMFFAKLSEIYSRAQTYFMGQHLGARALAEPEWGAQFIKQVNSPGHRKQLQSAIQSGKQEQVPDMISNYLSANNLLNYDTASKSAFARFMGPTFSAFTRWPSAMYGKMLQEVYDKGLGAGSVEVARKMMAPVAAIAIADAFMRHGDPSPRSQKILGKHAAMLAPGGALLEMPQMLQMPTSNIAGRLGDVVTGGSILHDEHAIRRALNDVASTFVPFMGWLKMFGEDLPLLITGKKPEGYTLERRVKKVTGN